MDFIKQCRLPPAVIKKLGLTFPRMRSNKRYGNVPFDYGGEVQDGTEEQEDVVSGSGHVIPGETGNDSYMRYGNVPFDYGGEVQEGTEEEEDVELGSGHVLTGHKSSKQPNPKTKIKVIVGKHGFENNCHSCHMSLWDTKCPRKLTSNLVSKRDRLSPKI